jgi:hypothetical protein
MITLHAKSPCCQAVVKRYGGRRRQCAVCGKTWRIRKKKRGPKPRRPFTDVLQLVFNDGWPLKACRRRTAIKEKAMAKRLRNYLTKFLSRPRRFYFRKSIGLILIIDAQWHRFKKCYWTTYLMAVKPFNVEQAIILDPVLLPGKETLPNWRLALKHIPIEVANKILAIVTDGFRGNRSLAEDNEWLVQRCHFHLLSAFQRHRGRRKTLPGQSEREILYQLVKQLLTANNHFKIRHLSREIISLAANRKLPARLRMAAHEFIRRLEDFHTYWKYPNLGLPNTTNVMESLNNLIRSRVKKINNPNSLLQWTTATIRKHPKLVCKRANYQPN